MKTENAGEVVIPELDELEETYTPKNVPWTPEEDAILSRYFNRVPIVALLKYLPGRSAEAVRSRARRGA